MNPRLVAVTGPSSGAVFPLEDKEISIGREAANTIALNDFSVSRKHCLIRRQDGEFRLADLESLNGTIVNRVPIKERTLRHGDEIQVGGTRFLFLLEGEEAPAGPAVVLDDSRLRGATTQLSREAGLYLHPQQHPTMSPRSARDLKTLLQMAMHLQDARSSARLRDQLLEKLLEAIPAQRACVLDVCEQPLKIDQACCRNRDSSQKPVPVSTTILDQALSSDSAVLCNDPQLEKRFREAVSLHGVHSILCIPMQGSGRERPVLYMDTSDASVTFDENDLQLATAACSIAASVMKNLAYTEWLESENSRLGSEQDVEHDMVGESEAMQEVYRFISKVARSDSTVLIAGESGTGKELVARAIHRNSPRRRKPFVAINCAALTETLLESELFGHEKGAFTGAISQKKGKLELADSGAVFLDEIGELAPNLQTKLLRVLQERELERVGGTHPIALDIRVIVATNKDLKEAMQQGKFRSDLYYRVNVVSVTMPPLRSRREDVPLLANYFARVYSERLKKPIRGISAEARAYLLHYDWPGNVRELQNAIERAVVMCSSEWILPEDLPGSLLEQDVPAGQAGPAGGYHQAINENKKQLILKAFEQAGKNYTEAARLLGLHPNYLHRLIRNLNLKSLMR